MGIIDQPADVLGPIHAVAGGLPVHVILKLKGNRDTQGDRLPDLAGMMFGQFSSHKVFP